MLADFFHRGTEKLHDFWQHLPLRWLGVLSAALPMAAVVVSAALAFVGNQNRIRMETAITRHFEMVERLNDLLTLMLNAETGLRGHLLAHQAEFLEPFALAKQTLPGELRSLRQFVDAEPGDGPRRQKQARLAEIQGTVTHEMTLLDALQREDATGKVGLEAAEEEKAKAKAKAAGTTPAPTNGADAGSSGGDGEGRLSRQFFESKETMDTLRGQLRGMQADEKRLLEQRLSEIGRVRRRDYLSISVALLLGLVTRGTAFWLFNRRVVRRVEGLTDNVRAWSAGKPLPHPPSGHHDAIGELEQALAEACQAKSDRR